jgi:hypothetical protein
LPKKNENLPFPPEMAHVEHVEVKSFHAKYLGINHLLKSTHKKRMPMGKY